MESTDGKMIGAILGNVDGITLGIDDGTDLGFFMAILMFLILASLRSYFLETHWKIRVLMCLALMKA